MKTFGKTLLRIISIIFIILFLIIVISYVNHIVKSSKEENLRKPLGKLVDVNGNKMSVYVEGNGDKTIVFMSGGGTCSPILDFKSLHSLLSDEYKVVVIEKFGYGFSDITDNKRDLDTILSESREALQKLEINGPYILAPHSMSGIEALYWAQEYPKEVSGIVGLDIAFPKHYENFKINNSLIKLGSYASKVGIIRFIPNVSESDAIKYGTLNEKEKETYRAIFYNRTATKNMIAEVGSIKENVKLLEKKMPEVPFLLFLSNGEGTPYKKQEWLKLSEESAKNLSNKELVYLNSPHYVHDYKYKDISIKIKEFLNN